MNFKIEINYLNIDNYPSIEKHFEDMATKGWLIQNIFAGGLFIYKRIEPKKLEFSISPYEVETTFTRKTKADLKEFQSVSENVGWKFATKSFDLHVYFKSKESAAVPIHTDEEEEFNTIELIAKRHLRSFYFLLPFFILFSWWNTRSIFNTIHAMKNGFAQITALLMPFVIMLLILYVFNMNKFLKKNRKNIKKGDRLEFNHSNQWLNKILYSITYLIFLGLILHAIYSVVFLNNMSLFIALLTFLIALSLGLLYRKFIKPIRISVGFKLLGLVVLAVIAGGISLLIDVSDLDSLAGGHDIADQHNYRILTYDDLASENREVDNDLSGNASLLIPESYDYTSISENESEIKTEYSRALNEDLSKNLVERYIQQKKNRLSGLTFNDIGLALEEGEYNPDLMTSGFTEQDFNRLYNEDGPITVDQIEEILFTNSITQDDNLWNVEEAYFLSYENDEMILRSENEVFYLAGVDFSDPTIVNQVKDQLDLE